MSLFPTLTLTAVPQLLYKAWKGLVGAVPRYGKAALIAGLLDEEISIDWGRVTHWYSSLPANELPPTEPPHGINEQFWDADWAMYKAVVGNHADIPNLEVRHHVSVLWPQ